MCAASGVWLAWLPELYTVTGPVERQLTARIDELSFLLHSFDKANGSLATLAKRLAELDEHLGDAEQRGIIKGGTGDLERGFYALCGKYLALKGSEMYALTCMLASHNEGKASDNQGEMRESEVAHVLCMFPAECAEAQSIAPEAVVTELDHGNALADQTKESFMRRLGRLSISPHPLEGCTPAQQMDILKSTDLKVVQHFSQDLDKLVCVFKNWLALHDKITRERLKDSEHHKQTVSQLMKELADHLPETSQNPRARKVQLDEWIVFIWVLAQHRQLQEQTICSQITWGSTTPDQKEFFANQVCVCVVVAAVQQTRPVHACTAGCCMSYVVLRIAICFEWLRDC